MTSRRIGSRLFITTLYISHTACRYSRHNSKNAAPFLHPNLTPPSPSLAPLPQPHLVLNAHGQAVHAISPQYLLRLSTNNYIDQELRGGTPYADLDDGTRLAVCIIKMPRTIRPSTAPSFI